MGGTTGRQYIPRNMQTVCALSWFVMIRYQAIKLICFWLTSLALGQSYDCPSVSEVTQKNIGKYIIRVNPLKIDYNLNHTKHNQIGVHILWGIACVSLLRIPPQRIYDTGDENITIHNMPLWHIQTQNRHNSISHTGNLKARRAERHHGISHDILFLL